MHYLKRGIFCLLVLLMPVPLSAQASDPVQTHVSGSEPIPSEELKLTDNPADPGAAAMVLYKEVVSDDEKRFENHYSRIKIFNDAGKKYADVEIPASSSITVENVRARSVQPDGTAVDFQGAIYDKLVVKAKKLSISVKSFTIPAVVVGSVIEFSYTIKWREKVPDVFRHPSNYIMTRSWAFPTSVWNIQSEIFTKRARFVLRPASGAHVEWAVYGLGDRHMDQSEKGLIKLDMENVPAFVPEEFSLPDPRYRANVHIFYVVGFPSMESIWLDHSRELAKDIDAFVGNSKYIEKRLAEIVSPNDPVEQKLKKIYAEVQKIRNLSYEPSMTEREQKKLNLSANKRAEDILKRNYGRGNELNLAFIALVRAAGFKARPVLLMTRDGGTFDQRVYDYSQFNGMVVQVNALGTVRYFDPATRFCPYALLPWAESDVRGLVVDSFGGFIDTTDYPSESAVVRREAKLKLTSDGDLEGTVDATFSGQEALQLRLSAVGLDDAGRKKMIEDVMKGDLPASAEVEAQNVAGWDASETPVQAQFKVRVPSITNRTSKRTMFSPAIFQSRNRQALTHEKRRFPVYFSYAVQRVDHLSIDLPANSQVEGVPAPFQIDAGAAKFNWYCGRKDSQVTCQREFEMKSYIFPVESYGPLRTFFQKVSDSDDRKVVLQNGPSSGK